MKQAFKGLMDHWIFQLARQRPPNITTEQQCLQQQINLSNAYNGCLWFSVAHFFIVSLLTERRSFLRGDRSTNERDSNSVLDKIKRYFRRYPGLPVPLNLLGQHPFTPAYTAAYICAFSVIGGLFAGVYSLKESFPNAPFWMAAVFKIFAIFVLSITVVPIFLSITLGGIINWFIGALYCLCHIGVLLTFLIRTPCMGFDVMIKRLALNLPILLSFVYLFFFFCHCLWIYRTREFLRCGPLELSTVQILKLVQHVKQLLRPEKNQAIEMEQLSGTSRKRCGQCLKICYPDHGFTYPTGLIWSLFVGVLSQYLLLTHFVLKANGIIERSREYIWTRYPDLKKSFYANLDVANARSVHRVFTYDGNNSETYVKMEMAYVYYWIDLIWLCVLLSVIIALGMTTVNAFLTVQNYQTLSLALRKRGLHQVPAINANLNPFLATRGWIIFPSYQIAVMACGFYLQVMTYTVIGVLFSILVTLNVFTHYDFINQFFRNWWPGLLIMVVFATVQQLVIRFCFTAARSKAYGFDNTRAMQLYTFFASFYSIFFGLFSGFGRVLYCPISTALCISRLDIPALGSTIRSSDTGYIAFVGYLYSDMLRNNPILRVFVYLSLASRSKHSIDPFMLEELKVFAKLTNVEPQCEKESPIPERKVRSPQLLSISEVLDNTEMNTFMTSDVAITKRAQKHWFLAYTLIRNPILIRSRKNYRLSSGGDILSTSQL